MAEPNAVGRACSQCLIHEHPGSRMKGCGDCKQARYCSVECQKKHWPEHKKSCGSDKAAIDGMKQAHGAQFTKSWNRWTTKECVTGLTGLLHTLLGDRTRTHIVIVVTDHQPGSKPAFKVVHWQVMALEEAKRFDEAMYEYVVAQMLRRDEQRATGVMAYALVVCRDAPHWSPRLLQAGTTYDDGDPSMPLTPEQIVERMNAGAFQEAEGQ